VEEVLECGEETYYPALHVGSERSAVVCISKPILISPKLSLKINALFEVWDCCYKTLVVLFEIKFIH
jgi:hypothetical protein